EQRGAMFLTVGTNMLIGIGVSGLQMFAGFCVLQGDLACGLDMMRHASAAQRWGENDAYDYFLGWTGGAPDPRGTQVAGTWAPFDQIMGPVVLGIGIGAITDVPDAAELPSLETGESATEGAAESEAGQVDAQLADAVDRAYTRTVDQLGPRADYDDPAAWGTRLHANLKDEIAADPFLSERVVYSAVGPDVQFEAGNTVWELTTPGQESAHLGRATWSAFVKQGWEIRWILYS